MSQVRPGLDIVMTGWAGLTESQRLAVVCREALEKRLPSALLNRLRDLPEEQAAADGEVLRDVCRIQPHGDEDLAEEMAVIPVEQGGILEALWNLAELADCGLNVSMNLIPVRQETIEVCEVLDVNPYQIPAGCSVYLTENGFGHPGRVIGQTHAGKARTVTGYEGIRYLDKPRH